MKIKLIALAIMAGAVSGMAHAQLSEHDTDVINAYQKAYPDVPGYVIDEMKRDWRTNLHQIQEYMNGVTYDHNGKNVDLPSLENFSIPEQPIAPPKTQFEQEAARQQQIEDNRLTQKNQHAIENALGEKQRLIADAARQQQIEDNRLTQKNQHAIENALDEKQRLIAEAARQQQIEDNRLTQKNQHAIENALGEKQRLIAEAARQQLIEDNRLAQKNQHAIENALGEKQRLIAEAARQQQIEDNRLTQKNQHAIENALGEKQQQIENAANQQRHADEQAMKNAQTLVQQQNAEKQHQIETAANLQQSEDVAQNTQARISQTGINTTLATGLQQAQNTGNYAQSRADAAYANTEANHQALQATNHRVADNSAAIANHEQRIEKLEANTNASFGKLKDQVDDNRQRASAAISGVAAMANIPQVIQGQTFSVGAGVGTTDGESALAVGFSARAAEHVVVKASVSDDTQQNFVIGGGVSYGW